MHENSSNTGDPTNDPSFHQSEFLGSIGGTLSIGNVMFFWTEKTLGGFETTAFFCEMGGEQMLGMLVRRSSSLLLGELRSSG